MSLIYCHLWKIDKNTMWVSGIRYRKKGMQTNIEKCGYFCPKNLNQKCDLCTYKDETYANIPPCIMLKSQRNSLLHAHKQSTPTLNVGHSKVTCYINSNTERSEILY